MITDHVAVDYETYYTGPKEGVSIKTMGAWHYLRHPKVGGDPNGIHTVSIWSEEGVFVGRPSEAPWEQIAGKVWVSHNAAFDIECFKSLAELQFPWLNDYLPSAWKCTANLAAYLGVKRDLKSASLALLDREASKDVRKQMLNKTFQEMEASGFIKEVEEYALMDSELCWLIWAHYSEKMPDIEHRLSDLTILQTQRGLPCNIEKLDSGIAKLERAKWDSTKNLPWAKPGQDGEDRILSDICLHKACRDAGIEPPPTTAEDDPRTELWEATYPEVTWIQDRRRYRKANLLQSKLTKMRTRLRPDSRLAYGVKYAGAHTLRWTGDAGFNVHGFGKEPVEEVDMRACVEVTEPGKILGIADLCQIEPRVLHWCAGNWASLDLIRQGMSVYEVHARQAMRWTGGTMKKEDPKGYRMAKDRVLGLGYGCGHVRFRDYVKINQGVDIGAHESKRIVNDYRNKEKNIKDLWDTYHKLLEDSVKDGRMEIDLPSWGSLKYEQLRVKSGASKFNRGVQITAIVGGGKTSYLWGSKIVENIVQRLARDAFSEAMLRLEDAGIPTILSVHDEVVTEPDDSVTARDLEEIMAVNPEWMPDVPLAAEAEMSMFYKK